MQCASSDQFSYAEARVTRSVLRIDLLDADDEPVKDTGDISEPAAPCSRIVIPKQ